MGETGGSTRTNARLTPAELTSLKSSVWVWPEKLARTVSWNDSSRASNRAVHSGAHIGTIVSAHELFADGSVAASAVSRLWVDA